MYDLTLQLILMISLGIVVYLMAVAVPRVKDDGVREESGGNNTIHISLERMDMVLNKFKDKCLRRLRVLVMKTDNLISKQLNKEEE